METWKVEEFAPGHILITDRLGIFTLVVWPPLSRVPKPCAGSNDAMRKANLKEYPSC